MSFPPLTAPGRQPWPIQRLEAGPSPPVEVEIGEGGIPLDFEFGKEGFDGGERSERQRALAARRTASDWLILRLEGLDVAFDVGGVVAGAVPVGRA